MLIAEYLARTRSAALHLFGARDEYLGVLARCPFPAYVRFGQPTEEVLYSWESANKAEIEDSLRLQREYIAEYFALAVICGSILQIAHQGMEIVNRVGPLPDCLAGTALDPKRVGKFCVGRLIRTIPLGLLVYASRNQHMHAADSELRQYNCDVLDKFGLVHVRESGELNSVAPRALEILGWNNYAAYELDMKEL